MFRLRGGGEKGNSTLQKSLKARRSVRYLCLWLINPTANKRELVADLMVKAKQIEYLINSLPEPEAEEEQAKRLAGLEDEMTIANEEYNQALNRASAFILCPLLVDNLTRL